MQFNATHAHLISYLLVLAHPLPDPSLGLCEIGLHLDEAQLPAPLDQLIRLGHQFLERGKKEVEVSLKRYNIIYYNEYSIGVFMRNQ